MTGPATGARLRPVSAHELIIRPITAGDKAALAEGFDRLSPDSRYRRFLSPHPRLSQAELRYFTEIDHHDHEALVALERSTGLGVGVARYVRSVSDPATAEFAVAVVDYWQHRGVGTLLAEALARRAREEGITRLTGLVLAGNQPMLNLAHELGDVRVLNHDEGLVELVITLPGRGVERLGDLLRAVATGHLGALPMHQPRSGRS